MMRCSARPVAQKHFWLEAKPSSSSAESTSGWTCSYAFYQEVAAQVYLLNQLHSAGSSLKGFRTQLMDQIDLWWVNETLKRQLDHQSGAALLRFYGEEEEPNGASRQVSRVKLLLSHLLHHRQAPLGFGVRLPQQVPVVLTDQQRLQDPSWLHQSFSQSEWGAPPGAEGEFPTGKTTTNFHVLFWTTSY